ncbi:MAG: peptidylprolyl isomerase [Turicibacter sp.]|nr:peptidylprolyl isomerase [Turicibacter sp.]
MNEFSKETNPIVTIEMETGEVMKFELYPQVAPESVNNFISLVKDGFYDGVIFHRVIRGFMIQGGDPDGTGMGGPGYSIKGEFTSNGVVNVLAHTRGVISFARSMMPNSAGSQFFIMHKDSLHLDGEYAAFGEIIAGIEVVDAIAESECNHQDRPVVEKRMKSVTVDTKGVAYPEPNKLKL